jgi:Tfp pilus assembly protein PilX
MIRRRLYDSEDGSIAIAVTVMLVMSIAAVAFLGSVTSGQNLTRTDQNRTNAFQYSNAGIDQAVWRVDTNNLPPSTTTGSPPETFVGGFTLTSGEYGFQDQLVVGGSRYRVQAVQAVAGQSRRWTIRSTGTDPSGRRRLAIATAEARARFENGFFTYSDFSITGNQTTPIAYRSSVCLDPRGLPQTNACILQYPVPGTLGSNGTIFGTQLSSGQLATYESHWLGFRLYGGSSVAAVKNRCAPNAQGVGQCTEAKIIPEPELFPIDVPAPTGAAVSKGCLTTAQKTGAASIPPGDYYCASLTLGPGTITVSEPAGCPPTTGLEACDVRIWVDGDFGVEQNTVVNRARRPQRFQMYQRCRPDPSDPSNRNKCHPTQPTYSGSICEQGGKEVEMWGLFYNPGLGINCSGQNQPFIVGSVVAHLYGGTGNQFEFIWDVDSKDVSHNRRFVITNWRECPPGANDC